MPSFPSNGGTLVDELFVATYHPDKRVDNPFGVAGGSRKLATQIRASLISAQRYFLTDDVVRLATDLGVLHPDLLLSMLKRARLPFPKMWIEWDHRVALTEQGIEVAKDSPAIVGAYVELISAPHEIPVYKITEMGMAYNDVTPRAVVHATSIIYSLDQPILERMPSLHQARSSLTRLTGLQKEIIDACLLGTTYERVARINDDNEARDHQMLICRALASYSTYVLSSSSMFPTYEHIYSGSLKIQSIYENSVKLSILESSGMWRFLVSVLAALQSREYTSVEQVTNAAKRRFVSGKSVPYLQHHRVSVKLPRKVILREMIAGERESLPQPRRTVEGYWRSRHTHDANCVHVDVAETPNRYRCALCKRALFFTPAHERGDAEVGYVKKDRVVESRD